MIIKVRYSKVYNTFKVSIYWINKHVIQINNCEISQLEILLKYGTYIAIIKYL